MRKRLISILSLGVLVTGLAFSSTTTINAEGIKATGCDVPYLVLEDEMDEIMYTNEILSVRADCYAEAEELGKILCNKKVHVTAKQNNRYRIDWKDGYGWILAAYVSNEKVAVSDNISDLVKVSSTAYGGDKNWSASGKTLIKNYSIAGKVEWLGKKVRIYCEDENGGVGKCLGTFSFDDTGYGAESGVGSSKILDGKTIGTIENGTCIDFYVGTEENCSWWGRRNVYIEFIG